MRAAPGLATLVVAVALAYRLAGLTWLVVEAPAPPAPEAAPSPAVTAARSGPGDLGARIGARHLFGRIDAPAPRSAVEAPETQLDLTLTGVVFTKEDPARAQAIIARGNADERRYRIGDELQGGARIEAIYRDRVLLRRGGRYETLRLPRERVGEIGSSAGAAPHAAPDSAALSRTVRHYRARLAEDPVGLAREFPAVAVHGRDGSLRGYRVTGRDPAGLVEKAGLRPGDVVTAVNGVRLDDPQTSLRALRDLMGADQITVAVDRDGRSLSYTYSLSGTRAPR